MTDLAQERAASISRRADEQRGALLRMRARLVLHGQWNASEEELRLTIGEQYGKLDPNGVEELLDIILQVQQDERTRIDPAEHRKPPAPRERPLKRAVPPKRFVASPSPEPPEAPAPAEAVAPAPTPPEAEMPASTQPERYKYRRDRKRVLEFITELRQDDPHISLANVRARIESGLGIIVAQGSIFGLVKAAQLQEDKARKKSERSSTPTDPVAAVESKREAEEAAPDAQVALETREPERMFDRWAVVTAIVAGLLDDANRRGAGYTEAEIESLSAHWSDRVRNLFQGEEGLEPPQHPVRSILHLHVRLDSSYELQKLERHLQVLRDFGALGVN